MITTATLKPGADCLVTRPPDPDNRVILETSDILDQLRMIVRNVYSRLWKFPSSLLDRLVESPRCKLQRPSGLRPLSTTPTRYANPLSTDSLPRIAQPSLWRTVIPSAWRRLPSRKSSPDVSNTRRSKGWNPATFYIVIFLLIGSQAIHMITLRKDFATFSRRADAKIALLKEVIERVQRGEDVDVKGLLGTGDKTKEKEWEEGM